VALTALPDGDFWRGKRVLLTGHTGFKGAWLSIWLARMGARASGISLPPATQPNLFELAAVGDLTESHFVDLRDAAAVAAIVRRTDPEIVLHLAAQALVRAGYRDPVGTFATNVQGTVNLLDTLRSVRNLRVVVAVTTDKVYRNLEHPFPYRESDALGGYDPYSASKAAAELAIACYRDSFLRDRGVAVASARAGNVIGGGDWSEDRLIPDAIRAWSRNRPLAIRRPEAIRPWQHVLEPLSAYLRLAEMLWHDPGLADAYNFGPRTDEAATVREVVALAQSCHGKGEVTWSDGSDGPRETGWLALEIAKARKMLRVQPRWALSEAVERTIGWYRRQAAGEPARDLCETDIAAFARCPGG
jgi:CDP-glucose 4,6-dehydratase